MKVLVTGGAGFIGSHSVECLIRHGIDVRVFDNFSSGKRENLPQRPAPETVVGDIRDLRALRTAMRGISHVLHLAAQVSVQDSIDRPGNSCWHNIGGFVNVIEAGREAGVERIVYASSAAVYGIPRRLPVDESTTPAPLSPYGLEKWVDDQYAAVFRERYRLSSLGLRYFNVYGPRQDPRSHYAGVISKFIDRAQRGEAITLFGDGLQTRDFVYVGDIAEVNRRALLSTATGVLNVATGQSVSLLDLVAALSGLLGRELDIECEPARIGDIPHSRASIEAIGRVLGYVPSTRLPEGLSSICRPRREVEAVAD